MTSACSDLEKPTAAISLLPAELLGSIITQFAYNSSDWECHERGICQSVCSTWRFLIISSSTLWRGINLRVHITNSINDIRQKMGWLELQLSRASTQTLEIEWAVADNPEWPLFKDELLDIFTRWAPIERWHSLRVTELAPRHIPFFRSLIFTKTFENLESFVWESFDEERHTMLPLVDAHLPPLPTSKFRQFECDFHIDHAQLHGSIATLIQYTSRFWTQDLRDFGEHFLPPNVHELLCLGRFRFL